MRNLAKKLKEKKGFTLVEMVVVLVIIAILATLGLGALTGYIDRANEKTTISNCRAIALAAQTVISEEYANGKVASTTVDTVAYTTVTSSSDGKGILELSGVGAACTKADIFCDKTGQVKKVQFTDANGKLALYTAAVGTTAASIEIVDEF